MTIDTTTVEQQRRDREAIVDISIRYATGVDRRDWTLYASCFTDPCEFDFTSFGPRPVSTIGAHEWADNVRGVNGSFDATQHLMSNHVITFTSDDAAIGINELIAQHWFTPETMEALGHPGEVSWCTLGGHYTNRYVRTLDGWKIARCELTVRWRTGNFGVFAVARARPDAARPDPKGPDPEGPDPGRPDVSRPSR